jgi:hypothetical protein
LCGWRDSLKLLARRLEKKIVFDSDELQTGRSREFIGPWLSLVERLVRDEEAASSNLAGPTISSKNWTMFLFDERDRAGQSCR